WGRAHSGEQRRLLRGNRVRRRQRASPRQSTTGQRRSGAGLCHMAVGPMTARGAGVIINVASTAALLPGRGTTYSASKAWVVNFTEGLATDLAGTGVHVQALCPGFVRTQFHESAGIDMRRTPAWMYVDADVLVDTSLRRVGGGDVLCVPGAVYRGVAMISRILPRRLLRRVAAGVKSKGRD